MLEKGADGKLKIRRHDRTAEHLVFPGASIRLLITGRGRGCATSWFLLAVVVAATAWAGMTRWPRSPGGPRRYRGRCCSRWGATPDPFTGVVTAPSDSTLRRALALVDTAELQRLTSRSAQASTRATQPDIGAQATDEAGDSKAGRHGVSGAADLQEFGGREAIMAHR